MLLASYNSADKEELDNLSGPRADSDDVLEIERSLTRNGRGRVVMVTGGVDECR